MVQRRESRTNGARLNGLFERIPVLKPESIDPLDDLIERLHEIPADANVVVCCQKGKRGPTAVRYLSGKGYAKVSSLRGGVKGWKDAGYQTK